MSKIDLSNPKVLKNYIASQISEENGEIISRNNVAVFVHKNGQEYVVPKELIPEGAEPEEEDSDDESAKILENAKEEAEKIKTAAKTEAEATLAAAQEQAEEIVKAAEKEDSDEEESNPTKASTKNAPKPAPQKQSK